jgi:hypothetical protein
MFRGAVLRSLLVSSGGEVNMQSAASILGCRIGDFALADGILQLVRGWGEATLQVDHYPHRGLALVTVLVNSRSSGLPVEGNVDSTTTDLARMPV